MFLTNGKECLTKFFACSIEVVFAHHENSGQIRSSHVDDVFM